MPYLRVIRLTREICIINALLLYNDISANPGSAANRSVCAFCLKTIRSVCEAGPTSHTVQARCKFDYHLLSPPNESADVSTNEETCFPSLAKLRIILLNAVGSKYAYEALLGK